MSLTDADALAERVLAGDRRALARTITEVENGSDRGRRAFQILYPHAGKAHIVGVTGSAGSGKSTLTAELARAYRQDGKLVGIVAVDPSSPFSRGAILGDRIRMQDLTGDVGVFMRSVATRGSLGGLSATTSEVAGVLAAAGQDVVLIETVGAGQDEVEIAGVAQTTLVVNTPGMGDDVQAIKAGIMEVADILVVNKSDLPGADAVVAQLHALLSLAPPGGWCVPVLPVSAVRREGIEPLLSAIEEHRGYLRDSGEGARVLARQARHAIVVAAQAELARNLSHPKGAGALDALAAQVAGGALDPRTAARRLLEGGR